MSLDQRGAAHARTDRCIVAAALAGIVGVCFYVAAWAVAGSLTPGFDPLRQAISETFAVGAPLLPAALVRVALVLSGLGLLAFAWALDRGLPGQGLAAPMVCATSGVFTIADLWYVVAGLWLIRGRRRHVGRPARGRPGS